MRRTQGWFSRLLDIGLWLLLCVPPVSGVFGLDGRDAVVAAAGVPLLGAAVACGRRRPLAALAVPVALSLLSDPEMLTPAYWAPLAVFGYLAGSRTVAMRPALWFFGALAVAGLVLCAVVASDLWGWPTMLLTLLTAVVLPWLLGRFRRQFADLMATGWRLAERMEHEQRAVADRTRIRERARIANDMHDSLGHDLTLIAVQAGVLEVDPTLDARQQAAVGELREAAGAATERLREIIGVLRADDEVPPRAPSDESADTVVERARASGVDVTLERSGATENPPAMVALAVHRVLQESLTNAAKHAAGAKVRARITRDGDMLRLTVTNDPAPAAGRLPGVASSGSGLVGLDERVRLAGGTLRAAPTDEGGFEVIAELPATGAAPRAVDPPRPTASAREQEQARRQLRRRLAQAVLAPLAVLAGILLLMIPLSLVSSVFSVLDREVYEGLTAGQPRDEVESRLPDFTRDGPPDGAPPTPRGQDCTYYSTRFMSSDGYRLCFADGRLVSKSVVGEDD
ncbi:two-component sensor histidine kinase [Streptomyces longisporoflavus]|uniref:sensor histidine kinase n=1 Tax=Streptomyces longisporoflavus TaxID=28044 RepID=UPI00167CF1A1|nr:histidine kinase [Streptomyces longisporoflavus]GGV55991.1 two-component sensor histidine kinase [Streptomyces longisporoflavus]